MLGSLFLNTVSHTKAAEYTFFSCAHKTFSRIVQNAEPHSEPCKFKKIEIMSSIFSDHNAMRLVINYKEKN